MKKIQLYDFDGREITQFAQWDTNVSVTIKGAEVGAGTPAVYFYSHASQNAYKAEATISGENLTCVVPSIVLQYASPVTVTVGFERSGMELVTPYATIIQMLKRAKPTDYAGEVDPEWSDISEQAKELIKEMTAILEEFEAAQSSGLTLPPVTASDNGKVLQVVDGKWVAAEVEIGTSVTAYVVGEPVVFTLSAENWNGTQYTLTADGYNVGANGVQIGLPSDSGVVNTQAVVEAALVIREYSNSTGDTTVYIVAIETPTTDLEIALFGLEAVEVTSDE